MSDYNNEEQNSEVELNEQDLEQVAGAGGGGGYPGYYPPHYFNESIHQVHESYEFEETDINITKW